MTLPTELLRAVSASGGGRIALVVGAGCSFEAPTSIPLARQLSIEVHRRLLADGVLEVGDCSDPNDLSLVADAVYAKTNFQRDVVERLRDQYDLRLAVPNNGYLIAAAMLFEGVISSVVTLNYDLALSNALIELGAGNVVGVVECPEDLSNQKTINIYYLHRNVNERDPELWVLRTSTLQSDWQGKWEPIIATKVLTAPVVIFAGLGTPIAVLITSTRLLRNALPDVTKIYQVNPTDPAESRFYQELALDPSAYIQHGWCQFMEELSQRLMVEHIDLLKQAVDRRCQEDGLSEDNLNDLLDRLRALGMLNFGSIRARWLLDHKPYCPIEANALGLISDLLLALAMMKRVSGAMVVIAEDSLVEFHRDDRIVAVFLVVSGRGYRSRSSIEADVGVRRRLYRNRSVPPSGCIVAGTSGVWNMPQSPPGDIIGSETTGDIIAGPELLPLIHISELRINPDRIHQVVP